MQPRHTQPEQIRQHIDSVVGPLNQYALTCYYELLLKCGVRDVQVEVIFLLP